MAAGVDSYAIIPGSRRVSPRQLQYAIWVQLELEGQLTQVIHGKPELLDDSAFWAAFYERLRATDTWAAGDPEHHSIVYIGQEFTGNLILATGCIAASSHSGLAEATARDPLPEGEYYEWEEWENHALKEDIGQESRRASESNDHSEFQEH